jgi:hypothetical protein
MALIIWLSLAVAGAQEAVAVAVVLVVLELAQHFMSPLEQLTQLRWVLVAMEAAAAALLAVTVLILFLALLHQLAGAVEVNLLVQVVQMEALEAVALEYI